MLEFFKYSKIFLKFKNTNIDNVVFKLHYKATFLLLIVFAGITTAKQYIGDPIDCIVDSIPQKVMDTYCWIYSTFTVVNKITGKIGKDFVHPGVAPHDRDVDEIKYHKYYQWVCFVLLLQAFLFYVPRYLWKTFEGGRIKFLSLNMMQPIVEDSVKMERRDIFVKYFVKNMKCHDAYFWEYFLCEFLNFANVLGQIFFMNFFLEGGFLDYGSKLYEFTHSYGGDVEDPMAMVFPKVTKCTFHKYGPSGTVQKFDGLCILPVNILNEKIYAILWYWFIILTIISGIMVFWRILNISFSFTRKMDINTCFCSPHDEHFLSVIKRGTIGDWFILFQVRKNMDNHNFLDFVESLDNSLKKSNYQF